MDSPEASSRESSRRDGSSVDLARQGADLFAEAAREHGHVARPLVALDSVSAAPGQLVFYVRGREASTILANPENPADAAIVGLVDAVREAPGEMR